MKLTTLAGILCLAGLASADERPTFDGFSASGTSAERRWEEQFAQLPSPDRMKSAMATLAAHPHHVGSPWDKANAEWILARYREAGFDARIESFDVLFPTPKTRVVELIAPTKYKAKLDEPVVGGDPTSAQKAEQLPGYNAYSIDGDVTAPLIYVNHGVRADYDALDELGVSVKGAIVIARYGGSWRGIKPKLAAEHGAVGCIIYSDPADDGYAKDEVYPDGPMRPRDGVQRGSVADIPLYPGDPLTPGVAATADAQRLPLEKAETITKIPTLPISYGDAEPLLAALKGPVAPESFRGALPITYHVGPGQAKVHLAVASSWDRRPVYDVIAKLPGTGAPDEWVIRGNHHDGWVNGAMDPISGQVALLEEATALGQLVKRGWRPRRTIIYASWDGEEPGLLGSTEWVEAHEAELREHAVAYVNSDGNGRGTFNMAGSPTLEHLVNAVARDVDDPETGVSVWKRAQLTAIHAAKKPEDRSGLRTRADLRIEPMGTGSDYTAFVHHAGVAAVALGFEGEDEGGIYHSIYDDPSWYSRFSDGDFKYGRALAQLAGITVMRLADAELIPLDFHGQADNLQKYATDAKKLLDTRRDEAKEKNAQLDEGAYAAASDPRRPLHAPARQEVPPHLDWAPLENALDALEAAADRYQKALGRLGGKPFPEDQLAAWNKALLGAEQHLLDPAGLPGRPWYRNLAYAPGAYTGYAASTFPGVSEAIERHKFAEAETEIGRLAKVIDDEAKLVDGLAESIEKTEGDKAVPGK